MTEVPEAPKVYCKKEDKEVPIWHCLGSFIQRRVRCLHNAGGEIYYGRSAKTYCLFPDKMDGHESFTVGLTE